jgi:carbamoyl-phosphate synthase small subunit
MVEKLPPATLALADGTLFKGRAFGALKTMTGEVVFNTSLTGYQEILTDPSYCGQFVTMTYPHIGNVGINPDDGEASTPWVAGLFVREVSRIPSNYRATETLPNYLSRHDTPGLTDLDTRALVRHIRLQGAMMAALSSDPLLSGADLIEMARVAPSMDGRDLVKEVTCPEPYHWDTGVIPEWQARETPASESRCRVVAYDFGIKQNILRLLYDVGCDVTIVPATTSAQEALALQPDGIFLSNGPGDPAAVTYAIEAVADLVEAGKPIFGICLGHQILGLALGGQTHKMKFGHRGGNQPVQYQGGPVAITSHNHGFAISPGSLPPEVEVTHINLNDDCIEGLRHTSKPIFSIQYHPEASPGPHDALELFEQFVKLMDTHETPLPLEEINDIVHQVRKESQDEEV